MQQIVKIAKQEVAQLRRFKIGFALASTIILPALLAALFGVSAIQSSLTQQAFWTVFAILVFLQACAALLSLSGDRLVQEVYFRARDIFETNEDLSDSVDALEAEIDYLSILEAAVRGWRVMERSYDDAPVRTKEEFGEALTEILSVAVEQRDQIFGFRSTELWNLGVYIFNPASNKLECVWRRKHHRHPSKGPGREWQVGQGHVGKAFADREPKITTDATMSGVADFMRPPINLRETYDDGTYKSFASIPIGPVKSIGDNPIGVLVATSNRSRFTPSNCLLLRHAAAVITNLIHVNKIGTDVMLKLRDC